jgi:hypothetical protein
VEGLRHTRFRGSRGKRRFLDPAHSERESQNPSVCQLDSNASAIGLSGGASVFRCPSIANIKPRFWLDIGYGSRHRFRKSGHGSGRRLDRWVVSVEAHAAERALAIVVCSSGGEHPVKVPPTPSTPAALTSMDAATITPETSRWRLFGFPFFVVPITSVSKRSSTRSTSC